MNLISSLSGPVAQVYVVLIRSESCSIAHCDGCSRAGFSRKREDVELLRLREGLFERQCLCTLQVHRPGSSVPELSNPVKAAPELSSSQHLSTSLQRLYRYFATVVRYFATSR